MAGRGERVNAEAKGLRVMDAAGAEVWSPADPGYDVDPKVTKAS